MKKIVVLLAMVAVLTVSGCVQQLKKDQMVFAGEVRNFRADLAEAEKVQVIPGEELLKPIFLGPIEGIKISYIPSENNGFYLVSGFELTNKLTLFYRYYYQGSGGFYIVNDTMSNRTNCLLFEETEKQICIESVSVQSADEVQNKPDEITLLMLGPEAGANRTAVSIEGRTIVLEGKDFSEDDRKYTDLDLAVDKLLLALMKE